jgi:DNA-binding beta-propeller fold protein YncE
MRGFRGAARCAKAWVHSLVLLGASACSDATPPPEPVSFERPTRVAFVCADATKGFDAEDAMLPLEQCQGAVGTTTFDPVPYALVLQSSRGEVAAVDGRAWRVLDSRSDIPGKTFVPVGALPVAIVAAPDSRFVYVAEGGSRSISVLRTGAVLHYVPAQSATVQQVSLRPAEGAAPVEPFDMVMSPTHDALFVSARDAGTLLRIGICADRNDGCEPGQLLQDDITRVPVDESWAKLPADAFNNDASMGWEEPYRYTCDEAVLQDAASEPPALPSQAADPGAPAPAGLTVDATNGVVLVADARQPIVHRIKVDVSDWASPADAIDVPILTGAPTERVAITPPVPVDLSSRDMTQYVYAIDVRDGSVLVAQDGRVRNVNANPTYRADRLDLGPSLASVSLTALSIEVVTPRYDVNDPWVRKSETPATESDPTLCVDANFQRRLAERLRGVFLAVGSTDGTVRIVNVHDMELKECHTQESGCARGAAPSYNPYVDAYDPLPIVRNRVRFRTYSSSDLSAKAVLSPTVVPQFTLQSTTVGVKADGTTNDTRVGGLDCIQCGDKQAVSFPTASTSTANGSGADDAGVAQADAVASANGSGCQEDAPGRVCSMADPYVDPLNWVAIYEGAIPGAVGGRGTLSERAGDDKTAEFQGELGFCSAGVLGDDVLSEGDQLVITSVLPPDKLRAQLGVTLSAGETETCNKLVSARDSDGTPIAFAIREAHADHLVISASLLAPRAAPADWELVAKCFAGLPLAYQVRVRNSFVVYDTERARFQHHVVADSESGRCRNDPAQSNQPTGRARKGRKFDNGLIAFQLKEGNYARLAALRLFGSSNAPKLRVSAGDFSGSTNWQGVMPVDLRYSPIDQRLYIVDITARGLMRLALNPMSSSLSSTETVQ